MIEPIIASSESESDILKLNLFTKYLNYIEKKQSSESCYANSHLINEHIEINFKKLKYHIPYDYSHKINKCFTEKKIRYIIIPIALIYENYAHYNIVIINKEKKTFEYFEPMGFIQIHQLPYFEVENHIYGIINFLFSGKIDLYKFVNANINCPVGLQKMQNDAYDESFIGKYGPLYKNGKMYSYYGLCVAWCLLLIHLRILNPDEEINNIVEYLMTKYNREELHSYIKRYMYLIENTKDLKDTNTYIKKNEFELKLTLKEIKHNSEYIKKFKKENNKEMLNIFSTLKTTLNKINN